MPPLPTPPSDPAPADWCTPERMARLGRQLAPTWELLALSGALNRVLEYWVRLELVEELPSEERLSEEEAAAMADEWRERHGTGRWDLPEVLLLRKVGVAPGCRRWARRQWDHRLQSLFLERKDELDQAACRLLRVGDKPLCHELYHRIKAKEASFEEIARRFGEGPERHQGGLIPLQPLARMPMGLGALLRRLREGSLSPPQRVGDRFAVVQLERFVPASLDAGSEDRLLSVELSNWIAVVVEHLLAHLGSELHSSVHGP